MQQENGGLSKDRVLIEVVTVLLNVLAPSAVLFSMSHSTDQTVKSLMENVNVNGLIDIYMQLVTLFVVSALTAMSFFLESRNVDTREWYKAGCVWIATFMAVGFLFIFTTGVSAKVPLEYYAKPYEPGTIHFPPLGSWVTQCRILVATLGTILIIVKSMGWHRKSAKDS